MTEDRKKPSFKVMLTGLSVVVAGMAVFFLAYIMRNYIKENLITSYRTFQSYGLVVVFIGVAIYMLGAKALKVPIHNTTFYKLETIIKDEILIRCAKTTTPNLLPHDCLT